MSELTRKQAPEFLRTDYCNLGALVSGTVSGHVSEWPMVRVEVIQLVNEHAILRAKLEEVEKLSKSRRTTMEQQATMLNDYVRQLAEVERERDKWKRLQFGDQTDHVIKIEQQLTAATERIKDLESESPTYKEICEVHQRTIKELTKREARLREEVVALRKKLDYLNEQYATDYLGG